MKHVEELIRRYPCLAAVRGQIEAAVETIEQMHKSGGTLLLAGNGGSAADCEHISGELLKGFLKKRPYPENSLPGLAPEEARVLQQGIRALPLPSLTALSTAFSNDCAPEAVLGQTVGVFARPGDVFFGISTSGNAKNVCFAARVARAKGLPVIALTGAGGGKLASFADITIRVPETETFKIQELHLPVYHAICAQAEEDLFA